MQLGLGLGLSPVYSIHNSYLHIPQSISENAPLLMHFLLAPLLSLPVELECSVRYIF
jgi:hypothetical protein